MGGAARAGRAIGQNWQVCTLGAEDAVVQRPGD